MRTARFICLGLLALPCLVSSTLAVPIAGSLVMRYDASVVTTSGSNVTSWNNLGLAGPTLNANALATPPTLIPSGPNGQPAVRFSSSLNNTLQTNALGSDLSQPLTILHVGLVTGGIALQPYWYDGRIDAKRAAYFHSGSAGTIYAGASLSTTAAVPLNSFNLWTSVFNGVDSSANLNGASASAVGNTGAHVLDGLTIGARNSQVLNIDGDIAELLVYNRTVDAAELKILSNHYSAKYDLPVSENRYGGDDPGQGHYDFHVFGVGNSPAILSGAVTAFVAGTVASGSEGDGLAIAATAGLDLNDYIMAGHKTTTNSIVMSDVSGEAGARWSRVWYIDRTDPSDDVAATLTFDLSDAGVSPIGNTYYLLYSPNNNFESSESPFTTLSLAGLILGDQISFSLVGNQLADGYYTLGTPAVPEPSTVALLSLGLAGFAWRRRGARRGR